MFFTGKDDLLKQRLDEIEDCELAVQRTNICMSRCNQPIDVLKQVLGYKFKLISDNITYCFKKYEKQVKLEDGTTEKYIDKNTQLLCLQSNLELLEEMSIEDIINIDKFSRSFVQDY